MKVITLTILFFVILILSNLYSCQSNVSIQTAQYAVNGQKLYRTYCQNCHGAKGEGLGKLYPPLTDHEFLKANREKLSCIVKNGLKGDITVAGINYNQEMPANSHLSDVDIAYILTYITTNFGQSDSTYTQKEVNNALLKCR